MTYPETFEHKIGFDAVVAHLRALCLSPLGAELSSRLVFSCDAAVINEELRCVREFRRILSGNRPFPLHDFIDVRESLSRLRLEGTFVEEDALFDLRRSMDTIYQIVTFLSGSDEDGNADTYPALRHLSADVPTFPSIIKEIDRVIDKTGRLRGDASPELLDIRRNLSRLEGSISRTLNAILHAAQSGGIVDKDAAPTVRDGRLVIPVPPSMKRKISGIVHDESATGKTVFIEPTEVVEANNRIRELEGKERREIVRILTEVAQRIRPNVPDILKSYAFLARIDLINAKASLAERMGAIEPDVEPTPLVDWVRATHPLLAQSLGCQGRSAVPLDITLTATQRILVISGPNAGGKSVCLKTVGLLQYMLQCGLSIPVGERSRTGVFKNIMIDIGDEQSIESDLSTYSGHIANMKSMVKHADEDTLLLIDEFGGGTEPQIGGAIAEAVLKQLCHKGAYGVITTHYQNLKHFADAHEGVVNGAMLYDRHEMRPLFQLAIGRPGSSFAIEIARKIGLPEEIIRDASAIVGSEYIQSDKYLQDIVRDKRYWENKRQVIHKQEKALEERIEKYDNDIKEIERSKKEILRNAREQAEDLLRESNRRIESTIREIKEAQAAREETLRIRKELEGFKREVSGIDTDAAGNDSAPGALSRREKRSKKRMSGSQGATGQHCSTRTTQSAATGDATPDKTFRAGDTVKAQGLPTVGRIAAVEGKYASVIFGDVRMKLATSTLEHCAKANVDAPRAHTVTSRQTRETMDAHKLSFKQDIDIRGMRAEEAIAAVTYFIDDAILVGVRRVRILHGTGTGALRQVTRDYLSTVPNVLSFRDEDVRFGGSGITVVDLQ